MSRQKVRWGDTLDDDDALPRSQTKGPDEHGNKSSVEYFRNDKGDAIKKTTKIKVMNIEKKTYHVRLALGRPGAP
jgi:translation initiation factor 3 subunit G